MRTKRAQRRKQRAAPTAAVRVVPDLFSSNNAALVEAEEAAQRWFEEMCPCCIDRMDQRELNRLETAYLKDMGKQ